MWLYYCCNCTREGEFVFHPKKSGGFMLKPKFVLVTFLSLFLFSLAKAQDPGNPDSVWISQISSVNPSQSVVAKVIAYTDEKVAGLSLPFTFYDADNTDLVCDSIKWASWVTSNNPNSESRLIDPTNHKLYISAVWYSGGLPAGRDTLAKIYFHTGSNWKSNKGVVIDSTTYYPPPTGARFEFIDEVTANTFIPILSKGCLGAAIKLTSPNGGEKWYVDENHDITWYTLIFDSNVKIEYSTNSGTSWSTVIASTPNDGTHTWTIPNAPSANCRVKVSDAADGAPWDRSDADFSIPDFTTSATPSSRVIDPGASTSYAVSLGYLYGFAHPITMNLLGLPTGATGTFSPNPVNPPATSSTLNINTTGSTPAGTYPLTIQGTGSQTHTTTVTLVVNVAPANFSLISPDSGSTVSVLTPTVRWHKSTDPDPLDTVKYIVYYTRKSDFSAYDSTSKLSDTSATLPTLSDDTVYYWKVKALDKWGKTTWSNNTWNFRVYYPQPPATFSLVSPTDRDTSWQLSDSLIWRKTTDPDPGDSVLYDLYIDSRSGFPSPVIIANLSDTFYYFTGKDDSTYYWKVLAKDINTSGRWSTQTNWRFNIYVPQAPNPFSLVSPDDGDTVILHPKLYWHKATDPDPSDQLSYRVFWSLDSLIYTDSSTIITDTSYTLPGLVNDTIYYWKVRVKDKFNLMAWCTEPYRGFRALNVAPASFGLISPADKETVSVLTPTLRWHKALDPDPLDPISYTLYYSLNPDFTESTEVTRSDTFYTPSSPLSDDTVYYWKVKAKDSYGFSTWSNQLNWEFRVYYPEPPLAFSILSPLNNSTLGDSFVSLYWRSTTDPDPGDSVVYDLYYDTKSGFTNPRIISNLLDTTWNITVRDDSTYYWKVKAKDTNTTGRWSTEVFKFSIYVPQPPRPFNLVSPEDGDTASSLTPQLVWEQTTDPDPGDYVRYNLYYTHDPDSSFLNADSVVNLTDHSYTFPSQLDFGTVYLWKVKAKDTNTNGTWNNQPLWSFYVPACMQGDVNGNTSIDLVDVVYLCNYLLRNGPAPQPIPMCGDANCSGQVNVADIVVICNYLFKGTPMPSC
jgi:hypothetical protein